MHPRASLARSIILVASFTFLLSGKPVIAQTAPSPNADIVKMIQAGLPEGTVVNKIHEGAGHWDTSVDALIVLKNAGATPVELDAISAQPMPYTSRQSPYPVTATPQSQQQISKITPNADAYLTEQDGTLQAKIELIAIQVVQIRSNGKGFRIGTSILDGGVSRPKAADVSSWAEADFHTITSLYASGCPYMGQMVMCIRFYGPFKRYDNRAQPKDPEGSDFFRCKPGTDDSTIQEVIIGFANLVKQSGGNTLVNSPTKEETAADLSEITRMKKADKTFRSIERQSEPRGSSGNGALALLNVMQGVQNIASAQSAANVAAANHDMAGQLQAAMSAGRAEAQTLNAVSNPNAPTIQPTATPDPNAIQNATKQQLANIQAKQAQAAQAQKSAQATQVARNSAPPLPVASKTASSPSSPVTGSGTAAPPVCVDLGVNGNPNCITQAQYQQTMAQKNQRAGQMQACPASGFVPGPGHYASCDAYLGDRVGCTPGQMVPVAVPAQPPASCGPTNAGNGGGGVSGGGAIGVPGTSAVVGDRAGCQPVNFVVDVQSQWFKPHDPNREVIYFVTNQTIGPVTCTVAFHKNGDWTEYGTGTYKAGATHVGGEGAGSWTMGADSSAVKYACYQGDTPLDAKGNPCNANLKFTGPTPAGTNWQ